MTAKQFYTAHENQNFYIGSGLYGVLVGYHANPMGFERLILAVPKTSDVFGWTVVDGMDFINYPIREGDRFCYVSVPELEKDLSNAR